MTTWQDGVAVIEATGGSIEIKVQHWAPWISRQPIAVLGSSGAGKTEVWRRLTGRAAPDHWSRTSDLEYLGLVRKRQGLAITTVPGQPSEERYTEMATIFGPFTRLSGVAFIASFGFDHVWPKDADGTADELNPYAIQELRARNVRLELNSFRETCDRIRDKFLVADRAMTPRWLLVIANKADLYWDERNLAANYYVPGSNSAFDT